MAREFVAWLDMPAGGRWLDVGCGSGALTETVLAEAGPAAVVGVDTSEAYVAHAAGRVSDPRASFAVADAQAFDGPGAAFDAVASSLVLNFLPDPARGVAEMRRVARPGGVVAGYVWDYAGEMQLMRRFWDAAAELDPAAAELDEGRRMAGCNPAALQALFSGAGLARVETRAIDVPTVFADFDDYWSPFEGGQGPAPGYCVALPAERRAALRERLRDTLPAAAGGSISLVARAWAVRGTRLNQTPAMSFIEDLEEYDAELEIRLKKEYATVFGLFRYCVLTAEATYLCNRLEMDTTNQPAYPLVRLTMEDVWVWDKNRPSRIIPRAEVHTTQDVTIEELKPESEIATTFPPGFELSDE